MEEEVIEKAVLAYLKSKGYRAAELAFQDEQQKQQQHPSPKSLPTPQPSMLSPSVVNHILLYSKSDNEASRYKEGYSKLRLWVHSSLDLYKNELLRILYPVFVHSFMDLVAKGFAQEARSFFQSFREDHEAMHLRDLQKLEGVISQQHLKENEFACTFRENKVNIKMCQYSFELLLQYLHSTESMLMLAVVNEHINLKVLPGQPSPFPVEEEAITLIGQTDDFVDSINQKEIRWGVLEDSLDEKLEKALAAETERTEADGKEGEAEDGKKKTSEGGKGAVLSKKGKKDKTTGTTGKGSKLESSTTLFPRVKPELSLPTMSEEAERRALEDLRNRVRLGSNALPSVSFYSFINTHNRFSLSLSLYCYGDVSHAPVVTHLICTFPSYMPIGMEKTSIKSFFLSLFLSLPLSLTFSFLLLLQ
ncbi:hypothetical protein O6H91_19G039200 [Diphasiastrum complanatum]|uniref:Uncharacterized protein n=1 Tax=Diphasiastrum complanatum TaxID=34168 RepID=A0ACC2AUA3_DIPCM|nr:hypothetical protein O6H91_19G039200 [Diphasiastrum complanatum]